MQVSTLSQRIADLSNENEQLKVKYKKCLQEIMHLLNTNKSMKEHLDQSAQKQKAIQQLRDNVQRLNMTIDLQKLSMRQLQSVNQGLENRIVSLEASIKDTSLQKQRQINQLSQSYNKLKVELERRKQLEHSQQIERNRVNSQEEIDLIKTQNEKLRKSILKSKGFQSQRYILQQQVSHLKDQVKDMNLKHSQEQQRWRTQMGILQNDLKRVRESEAERTRQLKSKYSALQTQLEVYKNIERQLKQVEQDQVFFSSIRSQIEKINDNFCAYQQRSSIVNRSQEDIEVKLKIIADLEHQLQNCRLLLQRQTRKIESLERRLTVIPSLQQKLKMMEIQRQQSYQKINVLEAFTLAQKHRAGPQVSQRIEQFERKVHLLLQEKAQTISGAGGLQQILTLKSCVKELSGLLQQQKKKQEKARKRNEQLKEKIKQMQHRSVLKVEEYNKKIGNYESLIQKLYVLLEQKVLQVSHSVKDKDVTVAIFRYEEKMIRMSDEIIKLKNKNQALQSINRTRAVSTISQQAYQQLSYITPQLQLDLQRANYQNMRLIQENKSLMQTLQEKQHESRQLIEYKESIIAQLEQQANIYEQKLNSQQREIDQLLQINHKDQSQIKHLHQQLQHYIQTSNFLLNNYKDANSLQKQFKQQLSQLQNKINVQAQQIEGYKQENAHLHSQLQSEKQQIQALQSEYLSQISQLTAKIDYFERLKKEDQDSSQQLQKLRKECNRLKEQNDVFFAQVKMLQEELHNKQRSYQQQKKAIKTAKDVVGQLENLHHQVITNNSKEIKDLNNTIFTLRTQNLDMRNELKDKQTLISELRHQIYTKQLKLQKQKSKQSLLSRQHSQKANEKYQRLLFAFILISAQLEAVSMNKSEELPVAGQILQDHVIEQLGNENIPLHVSTFLDANRLDEEMKELEILQYARYMNLHSSQSIQTFNEPNSFVDDKWKKKYQRRRQMQNAQSAANIAFRMSKLLSLSLPQSDGRRTEPDNKQ